MRQGRKIGVVIPALDEEQAIGRVIEDIPSFVDLIVVADNGSQDNTMKVAREAGAMVVSEPERGYGAACLRALQQTGDMDIIVFLDGDYSDYPQEMVRLVDPIIKGDCAFVVGSRLRGNLAKGALTPQQHFGNWLACRLMRLFWGARFTDLGPFRAIERNTLERLAMRDRNYGWTVEMQIKAARTGVEFSEVPVSYRPRIGTSKVSGTVKGTIFAGYKILGLIALSALSPAPDINQ